MGDQPARMRGRPLLLLVDGVEVMEGWRTLWDGGHAASGGRPAGRLDATPRSEQQPDASRRPRPRISACVSTGQRRGWLTRLVTTTRSLVEKEGRLYVVDVSLEDHGERRPDARTGPDSGGPTSMAGGQTGKLVAVDQQPAPSWRARPFPSSPHPRAPIRGKQTCAVNGGPTRKGNYRMKWIFDSHSVPRKGHSRIGGDVSAGCGGRRCGTTSTLDVATLSTLGFGRSPRTRGRRPLSQDDCS